MVDKDYFINVKVVMLLFLKYIVYNEAVIGMELELTRHINPIILDVSDNSGPYLVHTL